VSKRLSLNSCCFQVFFAPHPRRFSKAPLVGREPSFQSASLSELLGAVEVTTSAKPAVSSCSSSSSSSSWEIEAMRAAEAHVLPRMHRERVAGLDCDGAQVASVSRDGFVKVHLREATELRQTRASNLAGVPLTCCQLLEPETVLVGAMDSKVYWYSIPFGKCVDTLLAHDDSVSSLRCANGRLVTGGWDTLVRLWELKASPSCHSMSTDYFFLQDGAAGKAAAGEVQEVESRVLGVDIASNGVFVAAGSSRIVVGDFRLHDKVVRVTELDESEASGCVRLLQGDGRRAIVGNVVLHVGDGRLEPLFAEDRPVGALDAAGSLALVGLGSRVELWDTAGGERLSLLEEKHVFASNADAISSVCAHGSSLYAATEKGALLWL
jgi:WD40 repeat protein